MRFRTMLSVALALVVCLAMREPLTAAEPMPTTITVEGMHCAMCAKKIAGVLGKLQGVKAVHDDFEASHMIVAPQPNKAPSPRAMWDAVEKAGYKTVKLEGPSGTFTSKPRL